MGEAPISGVINTLSPNFSHTSIQIDKTVYESVFIGGVIKTPLKEWNAGTVVTTHAIPVDEATFKEIKKFVQAQVGKKYDFWGLFSFIFVFMKPKIGKWYCSELGAAVLMKARKVMPSNPEYFQKMSPAGLNNALEVMGYPRVSMYNTF
jgi:hypothetical protein